ncbi:MAG: hypothetical protein WBK77_03200 [Alphaproteobacteria bacterium]
MPSQDVDDDNVSGEFSRAGGSDRSVVRSFVLSTLAIYEFERDARKKYKNRSALFDDMKNKREETEFEELEFYVESEREFNEDIEIDEVFLEQSEERKISKNEREFSINNPRQNAKQEFATYLAACAVADEFPAKDIVVTFLNKLSDGERLEVIKIATNLISIDRSEKAGREPGPEFETMVFSLLGHGLMEMLKEAKENIGNDFER